jgi:hypothetical protein
MNSSNLVTTVVKIGTYRASREYKEMQKQERKKGKEIRKIR